ncbi:MAG: penicillin-binding protein 2 [Gammaproteobacteria bacterium]|nr:penicillin-binding protein 2 [Gammaproteobacteria bacterium]
MAKDILRDHIQETSLFSNRIITAAVITFILLLALIVRMVYLQIVKFEHFSTLSQNNRVALVPMPPTRGLIYDRSGVLMAENIPSFTLEITPAHIEDMDDVLRRLGKLIEITPRDLEKFHKARRQTSRFKPVPLRFRLTEEETAKFASRSHLFPGVEIQARLTRYYPFGPLGVQAVGYVGRISEDEMATLDQAEYNGSTHIGKTGVESFYETELHGKVGYKKVETNARGRILRILEETPPQPGNNLILNLDAATQLSAENALGAERGAVVAIDIKTGGVVALASMPNYDPNLFVNGIDSKTYAELSGSPDQPLFNRAIRGRYPPGSTIKPMVGLAGLEYGLSKPEQAIDCYGWYSLKNDDHRYRDWKKEGHGHTNLNLAIVESCDVYFYDLALDLGIDRLYEYMSHFGLGKRTNIDIGGELPGLMPSREWKRRTKNESWYPGETLITGIGQGFNLTTPLQLASATSQLAGYGTGKRPRLAYAFEDYLTKQQTILPAKPLDPIPINNRSNWEEVIQGMKDVVHAARGTARGISRDVQYTIAGKTGTAQVFGIAQGEQYVKEDLDKRLHDHALFIGFAPVEDPVIAVAVIVENGGSGGSVAAPVARQVMDTYMLRTRP